MNDLKISIVVVSYDRANDLELCLKALTHQYRRNFEIIVVCNEGSQFGIERSGIGAEIKQVKFDQPNISKARNFGLSMASGDIVAFIDDDAIAEPTWLSRLCAPFSDPDVKATGGFVAGRNGFDLQWAGEIIDDFGIATPIELHETARINGRSGAYPKTHGTNCAFRREELIKLGGFDENYHYFLDETDLNIRMGKTGAAVAIVPDARVHHLFSASHHRTQSRAPKCLFEIGASISYFNKKFSLGIEHIKVSRRIQRSHLNTLLVSGFIEPRDIGKLLSTLEKGIETGARRYFAPAQELTQNSTEFLSFRPDSTPNESYVLKTRRIFSGEIFTKAKQLSSAGHVVTVVNLSWTNRRMCSSFHRDGYWVHTGGMFGRTFHKDPFFRLYSFSSRVKKEMEFLHRFRNWIDHGDGI